MVTGRELFVDLVESLALSIVFLRGFLDVHPAAVLLHLHALPQHDHLPVLVNVVQLPIGQFLHIDLVAELVQNVPFPFFVIEELAPQIRVLPLRATVLALPVLNEIGLRRSFHRNVTFLPTFRDIIGLPLGRIVHLEDLPVFSDGMRTIRILLNSHWLMFGLFKHVAMFINELLLAIFAHYKVIPPHILLDNQLLSLGICGESDAVGAFFDL